MNKTNKLLKGLFSLDHNIKLYMPSTVNASEAIDNTQYVNEALELFSKEFGGATSYDAIGAWSSQSKGLILENVRIIESYATREQVEQSLIKVLEYAALLKKKLNQESIALEYNNKLYFI